MSAVIYSEEGMIALCRVLDHTEVPDSEPIRYDLNGKPVYLTIQTWKLQILAILKQGINAIIVEEQRLKNGDEVNLWGRGSAYCPWHVKQTLRGSRLSSYEPESSPQILFQKALELLTDEEKSKLLELETAQ